MENEIKDNLLNSLRELKNYIETVIDEELSDEEISDAVGEDMCENVIDVYADIHNLFETLNALELDNE